MVLCFSESWLDFEANHQGLYYGVCGVNPKYWEDYLNDLGYEYNSIIGGVEVYKYYLEQTENKKKALMKFKGGSSNEKVKKIVDKVIRLEKEYKHRIDKIGIKDEQWNMEIHM